MQFRSRERVLRPFFLRHTQQLYAARENHPTCDSGEGHAEGRARAATGLCQVCVPADTFFCHLDCALLGLWGSVCPVTLLHTDPPLLYASQSASENSRSAAAAAAMQRRRFSGGRPKKPDQIAPPCVRVGGCENHRSTGCTRARANAHVPTGRMRKASVTLAPGGMRSRASRALPARGTRADLDDPNELGRHKPWVIDLRAACSMRCCLAL